MASAIYHSCGRYSHRSHYRLTYLGFAPFRLHPGRVRISKPDNLRFQYVFSRCESMVQDKICGGDQHVLSPIQGLVLTSTTGLPSRWLLVPLLNLHRVSVVSVPKPKSPRTRPRSRSRSPPPASPPPLQTIRPQIRLGGPDNYQIDIAALAKATGQRPPSPVPAADKRGDASDSHPEDDATEMDQPKPKRKVAFCICTG